MRGFWAELDGGWGDSEGNLASSGLTRPANSSSPCVTPLDCRGRSEFVTVEVGSLTEVGLVSSLCRFSSQIQQPYAACARALCVSMFCVCVCVPATRWVCRDMVIWTWCERRCTRGRLLKRAAMVFRLKRCIPTLF
jgi:hypothetical protein